jgi:hypothetical protein
MSDAAAAWSALTRAALVGTERMPAVPAALPAELAALSAGGGPTESTVLRQAGLLSPFVRAGQVAPSPPAFGAPQAVEAGTPCGPRASDALALTLGGEHESLLPEWCEAAGRAGRCVPVHLLPQFLDRMARTDAQARPARLDALLGPRGRWLAGLRGEWRSLQASEDDDPVRAWETAARPQRAALLRRLRGRDPAAARALLEATREREQPDDLAAFVSCLEVGLSMADHDLLESLLDAKHKPVRLAAAQLLSGLPESALARRMVERVQPLLTFTPPERGLINNKAARIEVTPPADKDAKRLARDGVDTGRKRSSLGPKAATLAQMLASTPLSHWTAQWHATPEQIVASASGIEWHDALVLGWALACARQADAQWAQALLEYLPAQSDALLALLDNDTIPALMRALPAESRESLVLRLLEQDPDRIHSHRGQVVLGACRHPWSLDFTRGVLAVVRRKYLGSDRWGLRTLLPKLAVHFAPGIAPEIGEDWPTAAGGWQPADQAMLDQLVALTELRQRYLQELAP